MTLEYSADVLETMKRVVDGIEVPPRYQSRIDIPRRPLTRQKLPLVLPVDLPRPGLRGWLDRLRARLSGRPRRRVRCNVDLTLEMLIPHGVLLGAVEARLRPRDPAG